MATVSEIIGLGIGEETKGAWVEFLSKLTQAGYVWRKGGPQSGHHLIIDNYTAAMLSHFGAGVFQGIPTYVDMPIIPVELFIEAQILEGLGIPNPLSLMAINASCIVATPYHQAISRLQETLREHKKGTIGLGIGEAIKDALKYPELKIIAHDLKLSQAELEEKVERVRLHYLGEAKSQVKNIESLSEESRLEVELLENSDLVTKIAQSYCLLATLVAIRYENFLDEVLSENSVIETSHGAQLHPRFGYLPHVTQVDPVGQDAIKRLKNHNFRGTLNRFGVFRSYSTRFGAGPLVAFDESVTQEEVEVHHQDDPWLGRFRKGHLDLVGLSYGIKICGEPSLTGLMISYLDSLEGKDSWRVCYAYRYDGDKADLEKYFEVKGGLITAIKLHPDDGSEGHLDHQRRLTELLWNCSPIFHTIFSEGGLSLEDTFIRFVEKYLGLPVVAVAHGPRLSDRKIRPGYENLFV